MLIYLVKNVTINKLGFIKKLFRSEKTETSKNKHRYEQLFLKLFIEFTSEKAMFI